MHAPQGDSRVQFVSGHQTTQLIEAYLLAAFAQAYGQYGEAEDVLSILCHGHDEIQNQI